MKTVVRGVSLFLAAVLSIGIFTACDSSDQEEEKIPTIEEIFEIFNENENGKVSVSLDVESGSDEMAMGLKIGMDVEADGNLAYMVMDFSMSFLGEESSYTQEAYTKLEGNSITTYVKDEDTGVWNSSTTSVTDEIMESAVAKYKDLFNADYFGAFDKQSGRYTLKEGEKLTFEMDELEGAAVEVPEAYIEYKDGSYTLYAKLTAEDVSGTLILKCSDIGKVTVTLPENVEG